MACGCNCGSDQETNLVYACSGAANTGLLADQVMRALMRDKVASGTCMAALGRVVGGCYHTPRAPPRTEGVKGGPWPAARR